ncbi:MAG: glycoside hydrolase family 3 N-terminal domain-containing protein [Bacteroidota bacterium]
MQDKKAKIRKLAAQCVFQRLSLEEFLSDKSYKENILQLVSMGVGGFCIFKGDFASAKKVIDALQKQSLIPLLFSADFENGLTMRFSDGTSFPHAYALGKCNDETITMQVAEAIAKEAKAIGVNWNFAPVCDINSNPLNPIINIRAFGENDDIVSKHANAYISGTQSQNVIACAKHFPGHGDTETDSHLVLPVLNFDVERIRNLELKPFESAFRNGVKSVMVGHLAVPSFDKSGLPASLSYEITTNLLRKEMGFDGLIVTDALDMNAITKLYPSGEAAVKALEAGADVLLLPANPFEAITRLIESAMNDTNILNRLEESSKRILEHKHWCGLIKSIRKAEDFINGVQTQELKPGELFKKNDDEPFNSEKHEKLALKAAFRAIEIHGDKELIPLPEKNSILGFAVLQGEDIQPPTLFFKYLAQSIDNNCEFGFIDENISNEELNVLIKDTSKNEIVLLAFFYRARAYQGSVGASDRLIEIVNKIKNNRPTVCILFGNPYLEESLSADTFMLPYSDSTPSIAASIMYLSGRTLPTE